MNASLIRKHLKSPIVNNSKKMPWKHPVSYCEPLKVMKANIKHICISLNSSDSESSLKDEEESQGLYVPTNPFMRFSSEEKEEMHDIHKTYQLRLQANEIDIDEVRYSQYSSAFSSFVNYSSFKD